MSGSSSMTAMTPDPVGVSVLSPRLASTTLDELPEIVDLLLQLDHLVLTSDGQPLEAFELLEPLQCLGLLFGDLLLGLPLFGDVTGRGEHPQDPSAGVAVHRGVVQDLGQGAVAVTHRQR